MLMPSMILPSLFLLIDACRCIFSMYLGLPFAHQVVNISTWILF